tara:strand:+ start:73 stop:210 length:138 start_codon:yes stop_codon:yes gene_type:complete
MLHRFNLIIFSLFCLLGAKVYGGTAAGLEKGLANRRENSDSLKGS